MDDVTNKHMTYLTIFLIKEYCDSFEDCLKNPDQLSPFPVSESFGFEGVVYCCDKSSKVPAWKPQLDILTGINIPVDENTSNKAVVLAKINNRFLAITYGYGRALLKEQNIERNFGLRVALNLINPEKIKSVNAATIEDFVVMTQRQTSYNAAQEEFGLNVLSDIMKGVTGIPVNQDVAKTVSGKDSLAVACLMHPSEYRTKLEFFLSTYDRDDYTRHGFSWVDNVGEVRDGILKDELDMLLADAISNKNTSLLHISPPEIIDWEKAQGFCFGGIQKNISAPESYTVDIQLDEYLEKLRPGTIILSKIQRDKLFAMTLAGEPYAIGSVYNSLIFQVSREDKTYILAAGEWYAIENSFFNTVRDFVVNRIPVASISLPDCPIHMDEGDYNKLLRDSNPDYCLLDCKLVSVEGGRRQVEPCDIFTKNKQFIHVKNKGKSAQLSHLFAQGRISAQCFLSDFQYRKQIDEKLFQHFGESIFDATNKPITSEYEIVFAIIDTKDGSVCDTLPFFSLLNLMLNTQDLERMHYKYSIVKIKKQ